MLNRRFNSMQFAIGCGLAALAGLAQATDLTPVETHVGNTTWQNIGGLSYTFADLNHDGVLDVGDKVTFTVDMEKANWGTHRYDALKFWIDDGSTNLFTDTGKWFYDPTLENMKWYGKSGDTYSYRPWTGGDKHFSFDYIFTKAGTFDIAVSVTCSRDLSGFYGGVRDDKPTKGDWKAWGEDIHASQPWLQGEDKDYRLTVAAVPEPETYAMLLAGLGLIGAVARRRKS